MNKLIPFLGTIILLFLLNILLYSSSENYRFFIKKIKNPEEISYPQIDDVNEQIIIPAEPSQEEIDILSSSTTISNQNPVEIKPGPLESKVVENKIVLGQKYQDILNLFSRYNLGRLELHSTLFDVTDEYPDDYYEYYSRDLLLYFFPTKNYTEIFDIFNVQQDLAIELNETNSFGDNSFFINIIPEDTKNVRLIINYKSIVFGLKIKKDEYTTIKNILNTL